MTPISKPAPLGGNRHFSSSRGTSALFKAVSHGLLRQPRTSQLYIGQSAASIPTPTFFSLRLRASSPSLVGGEWLSVGSQHRAALSGSAPWRTKRKAQQQTDWEVANCHDFSLQAHLTRNRPSFCQRRPAAVSIARGECRGLDVRAVGGDPMRAYFMIRESIALAYAILAATDRKDRPDVVDMR